MQRYIGLDVHAASTTFAVVGESGKRLGSHVVETNGQALVEQLKAITGKRHVVLEEGTQSGWLYEILSPHAEESSACSRRWASTTGWASWAAPTR
ncbi:hypothetical protein ACMHYB_01675 [Sorangium sp. So ce1128]